MGETTVQLDEGQCQKLVAAAFGRLPSATYDPAEVLGASAWRRIAEAVDTLAHVEYEDFQWSPGHLGTDGHGGDRRWMLRRLATLPGLRDVDDVRELAGQVSGALGTAMWDPVTVGSVLVGWGSETPLPALQALGRAFGRGADIAEAADVAGVNVDRAREVHRFLGVSQLRDQQDMHLALQALEEGWSKAELRRVSGWGNGKWARMVQAARDYREAEELAERAA